MNEHEIGYALAKKVPDMLRGIRVETSYGEIEVSAEEAQPFADLMQRLLEERRAAQAHDRQQPKAPLLVGGLDYLDRMALGLLKSDRPAV